MAYTAKDAILTLSNYLNIDLTTKSAIEETGGRGFEIQLPDGQTCVVFVYPISHKADDSKNFFDTRDSGARERGVAWNYAREQRFKYFCLAVHDQVEKFKDYIFSLECDEKRIAEVSGTLNGARNGSGTQVVIPKSCVPTKEYERIYTENGFFISVVKKDHLIDYLCKYDNRPYMENGPLIELGSNTEHKRLPDDFAYNRILFGAPGTGKSHKLEDDCETYFCDGFASVEELFIEDVKNKPQGVNENVWFRHIGIKYASFIFDQSKENDNRILQERWTIDEGLLVKLKNTARALVDYGHIVSKSVEEIGKRYERVTFHPNYSYAQFVGTYKPVQDKDPGHEKDIVYKYVEGPFMRVLVKALKHPESNFLLIIEEINRANVAAVFGDVFQLLDRKNGVSEYPVAASEDIKRYLKDNGIDDCNELKIPSNMYIWATMNSADQGVFPMDTAFKRRWEFEYIGINENQTWDYTIPLPNGESINWNVLRKAINGTLKKIASVNEDKLLGPYFLSKAVLEDANKWNSEQDSEEKQKAVEKFLNTFKSKVLMYLYEDVCKMRPGEVFKIKPEDGQTRLHYSDICDAFDLNGIEIFGFKKADIEETFKKQE